MSVNSSPGLPAAIFNPMVPKEGPKMIPVPLNFAGATSILTDLSQQQQQGRITFIQSLYIDNSQNTAYVDIVSQANNLRYRIPAGSEAILPFFLQNPPQFVCNSTGGIIVPMFVMNVPLNPVIWSAGGESGTLIVSDPALEALITNPEALGNGLATYDLNLLNVTSNKGSGLGLDVNVISGGGGGGLTVTPTSEVIYFNANTGLAVTANSGSNKWYMTGWEIYLSGDATLTGGGTLNAVIERYGNSATLVNVDFYVPGTALGYDLCITRMELGINPITLGVSNDQIAFHLPGTLTTGTVRAKIFGYTGT